MVAMKEKQYSIPVNLCLNQAFAQFFKNEFWFSSHILSYPILFFFFFSPFSPLFFLLLSFTLFLSPLPSFLLLSSIWTPAKAN